MKLISSSSVGRNGQSVGATGRNKPIDVMMVQHLLNHYYNVIGYLTPITGILNEEMTQAIKSFQRYLLFMKNPNGRVYPWEMLTYASAGLTRDLVTGARKPCDLLRPVIGASRQARVAKRHDEASSSLSMINTGAFLKLYELQFGMLGATQRAGLTKLIKYINEDKEIQDVGWCAYMLATVKYECKDKWEPISEPSKWAEHRYGRPDPYYGRGYIPLTGLKWYLKLEEVLGLDDDLAKNPDHALDPDIAYEVMSYVMRKGLVLGDGLPAYINATRCDYLGARRIIFYARDLWGFGQHGDVVIQAYAENLELLLRVSCYESFSDSPYWGFEQERYRYNAESRALVQSNLINVCCPDPQHPYRRRAENICRPY